MEESISPVSAYYQYGEKIEASRVRLGWAPFVDAEVAGEYVLELEYSYHVNEHHEVVSCVYPID